MVGLGIMGSAMSASLMRAGHPVIGYDISAGRRRDHRRVGGEVASTCGEVGTQGKAVSRQTIERFQPLSGTMVSLHFFLIHPRSLIIRASSPHVRP